GRAEAGGEGQDEGDLSHWNSFWGRGWSVLPARRCRRHGICTDRFGFVDLPWGRKGRQREPRRWSLAIQDDAGVTSRAVPTTLHRERGIDGVSETDGLEATSKPLGPSFPRGMLVVQDGFKRMPGAAQNFKYVAWEDVARALGLP
ncbi:phytase, partial [Piscinibacter sp.]|uniref:phytase n=1 Tax=Piscinibacter sp. TaxID=1903157 RepID=UPI002C3D6A42